MQGGGSSAVDYMCICKTLDSILNTNKKIKIKDVVDKTEYVQIKKKRTD